MAKDVITRFKLETTGFDSKIKEAAKELSAYSKTATQAKEGFNQFTKANVDAARALGTMTTSTTNAKDRAKELVGAFNEAAKAYNSLTKEQQQSDWAKALAGSLTQLQQRIKETKAEMQGLGDSMKGANDGSLLSKLGGKMDGALAVFGGNLMTKAAGMGVGLITEMTDAVKQGIELAKAGEGVRIAFERLGRGDILQGLREATHGTVTDLELMKAAVKFNDFKLPVEELGTMLAFAQQKAKDTGQSVDYMVDSIVTGLGRKSLMILDNLGLSASEIRERMKETGDMTKAVGAIIREQMASAGEYVETAADRAAQANVSLQNKMEELGRKAAPLEESFNHLWTSMKVGILDVIGGPLTDLLNKLTQAGRMANQYSLMGGNTKVGRMTSNLANASEDSRQSIYQLQKSQFWKYINPREQQIKDIRAWQSGERNETLQKRINVITQKYGSLDTTKIQAEVDAAKKMLADYEQSAKSILQPVNAGINTKQAEQNVTSLRKQLKELEEQRKKAVKAGDQEQVENLTKQISQVKTNLGYLDPKANKTGSSKKTVQTELQQNQTKINALTQEYVKLGDESTEAARERQAEIQKEIELLQQRNGLLGLRAEQAQGRLLPTNIQTGGLSNTPGTLLKAPDTAIPTGGLQLSDKAINSVQKNIEKQLKNDEKNKVSLGKEVSNIAGGVSGVFSGLQQLGIELPEGLQNVLGGMQAITTILTGIATTVLAIEAIAGADALLPFFANGGTIPHAANGYFIGGSHFSGDVTPIMANAGELVLNKAQQGNLASQLQGGGMQNLNLTATIKGEQIRLALNNNGRRTGRGEYVQSRNVK